MNNGIAEKTVGSKYECEVKPDTKYNFYVLTTPASTDTTINLIMDRNICEDGTLTEEGKTCLVSWNSNGSNLYGPVAAMNYLYNATKDCSNIPNIEMNYVDEGNADGEYGYGKIVTANNITKITKRDGSAVTVLTDQEGYDNLKARMPYKSEIKDYDSTNKTHAYLYDFLMDSSLGGRQTNIISGIEGYWTLASIGTVADYAYSIHYDGYLWNGGAVGVRPVINIQL